MYAAGTFKSMLSACRVLVISRTRVVDEFFADLVDLTTFSDPPSKALHFLQTMSAPAFDSLSPADTCNIARFFSARPLARNWKSFVDVHDAMQLCFGEDAVSESWRGSFTAISTCPSVFGDTDRNNFHFPVTADSKDLEGFLRVAAQHILGLEIPSGTFLRDLSRLTRISSQSSQV